MVFQAFKGEIFGIFFNSQNNQKNHSYLSNQAILLVDFIRIKQ